MSHGLQAWPGASGRRFAWLWIAPTLVLLLVPALPLITGGRTLYLRDVFNTHLERKWVQAEAMREGGLPLVDVRRGGQPHVGNPNTVSLYPDNLLYLAAPPLWAFNAHFWLHLLLAPACFFWLARAWGLEREGAWAAAVFYAGSGYFLSNLNLYNLVAGATLAPAFAAALLDLFAGRSPRRSFAATALLWALLLLAGDPTLAAVAILVAGSVLLARRAAAAPPTGGARSGRALEALALGSVLAAPQLVEFLRILPFSFRGFWGYSAGSATAASWSPAGLLEWLVPMVFGRPDLSYWGRALQGGDLPLYFSLYPGLAALVLVATSGRPRGALGWWPWALTALGLFVALGRHNPVVGWALALPGMELLRLPVKSWLLVAVGGALLAGRGFERWREGRGEGDGSRRVALAALGALFAGGWVWLAASGGGASPLRAWIPATFDDALVRSEASRLRGLCLLSLGIVAVLAGILALRRRAPLAAAPCLLVLHLAAQLALLKPLLATDSVAPYLRPPLLLEAVPEEARLAHGHADSLFGPYSVSPERYPDARLLWLQRQTFEELFPNAGIVWGRRYELRASPEGLDSFLTRAAAEAVRRLSDKQRMRLLEAFGVDHLLLGRDLDTEARERAELVRRVETATGGISLYRLPGSAPEVSVVGTVRWAPHLPATLAALTDPSFDPRGEVVLAGQGAPLAGPVGTLRSLASGPERLAAELEAPGSAALVVRRAYLPVYRASVDGEEADIVVANLHQMAVLVPPGRHRVEVRVDRRPFGLSALSAGLAAALLGLRARRVG